MQILKCRTNFTKQGFRRSVLAIWNSPLEIVLKIIILLQIVFQVRPRFTTDLYKLARNITHDLCLWRLRENIIRTVLRCIVYDSCAQWYAHTWPGPTVSFFGIFSL